MCFGPNLGAGGQNTLEPSTNPYFTSVTDFPVKVQAVLTHARLPPVRTLPVARTIDLLALSGV